MSTRRISSVAHVGRIAIGGDNPIRIQSMATTDTNDTDGSVGAAKGAGIGAGIYKDNNEAFATLDKLEVIEPDAAHRAEYLAAYARWKAVLEERI